MMSADVASRKAMDNGLRHCMFTDTMVMGVSLIVTVKGQGP